ncbi:MAG TPA: cytochrome c maturation protein CcmE [Salinarimonas sp.]|jgi:cytochrome c-type biogenesis protein CcmE|nr:cytochrome c maturation protein CcmE [Salinarimonas sp.]
MTRKQRRLTLIGTAGLVLAAALGLVLFAMSEQIMFFHSPQSVAEKNVPPGTRFRLGGLVQAGSVERGPSQSVRFRVEDATGSIPVAYTGLLPDLFREGQGVVTEGALGPDGVFRATTVLARHDENYMPREVADALKAQGHWQAGGPQGASKPAAPVSQ